MLQILVLLESTYRRHIEDEEVGFPIAVDTLD
jgi:hypothetical protein